jgi:hypothetical protein
MTDTNNDKSPEVNLASLVTDETLDLTRRDEETISDLETDKQAKLDLLDTEENTDKQEQLAADIKLADMAIDTLKAKIKSRHDRANGISSTSKPLVTSLPFGLVPHTSEQSAIIAAMEDRFKNKNPADAVDQALSDDKVSVESNA